MLALNCMVIMETLFSLNIATVKMLCIISILYSLPHHSDTCIYLSSVGDIS